MQNHQVAVVLIIIICVTIMVLLFFRKAMLCYLWLDYTQGTIRKIQIIYLDPQGNHIESHQHSYLY